MSPVRLSVQPVNHEPVTFPVYYPVRFLKYWIKVRLLKIFLRDDLFFTSIDELPIIFVNLDTEINTQYFRSSNSNSSLIIK